MSSYTVRIRVAGCPGMIDLAIADARDEDHAKQAALAHVAEKAFVEWCQQDQPPKRLADADRGEQP